MDKTAWEDRTWWLLVGGRRRLGRELAQALAKGHNLILTTSVSWDQEEGWIAELSKQTQV